MVITPEPTAHDIGTKPTYPNLKASRIDVRDLQALIYGLDELHITIDTKRPN